MELVKVLPEVIRSWVGIWKEVLRLLGGVAAVLLSVSAVQQKQPLIMVTRLLQWGGLDGAVRWAEESAPPFMSVIDEDMRVGLLVAVVGIAVVMVGVSLVNGLAARPWCFMEQLNEPVGFLGASIIWILLLLAQQHGDVGNFVGACFWVAFSVGAFLAALGVAGMIFCGVAKLCRFYIVEEFFAFSFFGFLLRVGVGVFAPLLAIWVAALWLLARVVSLMVSR